MRRGINIRKKNRITLNQINKKTFRFLSLLIILLLICLLVYFFFLKTFFLKKNFESDTMKISNLNENIPFVLNKIILFSSATAETENVNHSFVSLDISQYCDIGMLFVIRYLKSLILDKNFHHYVIIILKFHNQNF